MTALFIGKLENQMIYILNLLFLESDKHIDNMTSKAEISLTLELFVENLKIASPKAKAHAFKAFVRRQT